MAVVGWVGAAAWRRWSKPAAAPTPVPVTPTVQIGGPNHTQVTIHTGAGAVQQTAVSGEPTFAVPTVDRELAPHVPVTRIAPVSLQDIRRAIDDAPPLQREDITRHYIGLNIQWETSLAAADKKKADEVRVRLSITGAMGFVWCTVKLSEYRELAILKSGTPITISGRIRDIDAISVDLEDARLFFTQPQG